MSMHSWRATEDIEVSNLLDDNGSEEQAVRSTKRPTSSRDHKVNKRQKREMQEDLLL